MLLSRYYPQKQEAVNLILICTHNLWRLYLRVNEFNTVKGKHAWFEPGQVQIFLILHQADDVVWDAQRNLPQLRPESKTSCWWNELNLSETNLKYDHSCMASLVMAVTQLWYDERFNFTVRKNSRGNQFIDLALQQLTRLNDLKYMRTARTITLIRTLES